MSSRHCLGCRRPFSPNENSAGPFCSQRCKTIDLGKWLGEEYRIPEKSPWNLEDEGAPEHESSDYLH